MMIDGPVPQTYGEAVELYPWLRTALTAGHEWDNRTTPENTAWLIEKIGQRLEDSIVERGGTCYRRSIGTACQCILCDVQRLRRIVATLAVLAG